MPSSNTPYGYYSKVELTPKLVEIVRRVKPLMTPLKEDLQSKERAAELAAERHSLEHAGTKENDDALAQMNSLQWEARAARATADALAKRNGFKDFSHWEVIEVRVNALH